MNIHINPIIIAVLFFFCSVKPVSTSSATVTFFRYFLNFHKTTTWSPPAFRVGEICNYKINQNEVDAIDSSWSTTTPNQETRTICADESYQFGNQLITTEGIYTHTFTTLSGCDSTVELTIFVEALVEEEALVVAQPAGTTYFFGGQDLSVAGTYFDTLNNPNGCNTFRSLRLLFIGALTEDCNNGMDDDNDGFIDAFDNDCDCLMGSDTLISNEIIVDGNPCEGTLRFIIEGGQDLPIHWFKDSIPLVRTNGGNLNFNALSIQDAAGTYHGKVTFEDGNCQLIGPLFFDGITIPAVRNITLCEPDTYQLGDSLITSSGSYLLNFPSEFSGCDSAITLNVTYLQGDSISVTETIRPGETYDFNGQLLTTAGIYIDAFQKESNGCDSLVILTLNIFTGEICDNLIDDDGDGLIDAFDEDCQCNLTIDPKNLVPNGDFELYEEGCCTRSTAGEDICVDNWTHTFSTPDFVHPNCIGLATPAEANFYDVPLDNAFFGILMRHSNISPIPEVNGMTSETIGQCLPERLEAGETYVLSLDVGVKGNLDGTPADLTEDIFFTINGISDCSRLGEYLPDHNFCESELPYQQLAAVNLFGLNRGWNPYTFEFTPHTDLEAIFVMGDCDLEIQGINIAIALFDNLNIQKRTTNRISNEITVTGNPCDANDMLRFSVEQIPGATYQWYLDSVPKPTRITPSLTFGLNADIIGSHHVYVTFPDGHCELIGPYDFDYPAPSSRDTLTICPGTTILVGENIVSFEGEFTDTFPSIINGCDSTATLVVLLADIGSTHIFDTIVEGQSYDFNGTALTTTGTYIDTVLSMSGCDSLLILNLTVKASDEEICNNNIDDDGDGLVDIFDPNCQCDPSAIPIIGDTIYITQTVGTSYNFHGFTYEKPGIYQANLISSTGCDSLVWLNLNLETPCANLFEVMAEWSDVDCATAENGQIILEAFHGSPPIQYSIDGGINFSQEATFNNLSAGDYDIAVTDNNGCISTNSVTIGIDTSTLLLNLPADTFLYAGQSFNLNIEAINFEPTQFNWTPKTDINCFDCRNIRITPATSTTYTLTATNRNGCQIRDAIFIDIKPIPQLYIPTAFSPNGDGQNDVFKLEGLPEVIERVAELKIFNRWGNLIYQQHRADATDFLSWNGMVDNQVAMIDVYLYFVSWENQQGKQEILSGDFLLMR